MGTAVMGVGFVVVGFAAMFLMYRLWGYPYDKARRLSAAPRWAMRLHRVLGYVFVATYVGLMVEMIPRLWTYQVELPARTTAHIILGFTIGFLLLVKITVMRWFRHFEEWMPYLGTAIMLGTVVLLGLSLPYVFQERALARSAPGGSVTSVASLARVAALLPAAGLPEDADIDRLSTATAMRSGRRVLLGNCVKCHDLRTVLARPRTPSGWWSTVERMSEKPALFASLTRDEMLEVTAYLIAITPDLQRSSKENRLRDLARDAALAEDTTVAPLVGSAPPETSTKPEPPKQNPIDLAKAKKTYEAICSQCHELAEVDAAPPRSPAESRAMLQRMIKENDAEISREQFKLIAGWLDAHFVAKTH